MSWLAQPQPARPSTSRTGLLATAAVIVLATVTLALTVGPAAAVPAVSCGRLTLGGKQYTLRAHVLSCSRARAWTRAYLRRHHISRGYVCRRFNSRITRVVFVCDNPATETRLDGPQSFTASR